MDTVHQPGDIIADRYRIFSPLGQGNLGMTYEAEDLSQYQRVVIKVFPLGKTEDQNLLEQFEQEAKGLRNLNHQAIPQYLDYFFLNTETHCYFYSIQALAPGDSLIALVQQGWNPTEQEVKQIAIQILEILDYLHQIVPPIMHRDLNPHNIIRRPDGEVYLVNFGGLQELYRQQITLEGTLVKTFAYLAPEQFRGHSNSISDLYGLGTTLLFLLTRRSPHYLVQTRLKYPVSQIGISEDFAAWLDQLLNPIAEDRFPSAANAQQRLKNSSQVTLHRPQKQRKNPIRLQKSDRYLLIEIPPQGLQASSSILCVGVGIWVLAILGLFALSLEDILVNFILLCISAIGLFPLALLLWQLDGHTRLEIDPQRLRVQWKCLDVKYQLQGKTSDITQVKRLKTMCRIWEGDKFYNFAKGMTPGELQWIVKEISEAIERINHLLSD